MARTRRIDYPGAWHHVVNRGLAKRPAFPHRRDVRFLLSRLARSVRRGEIEIHAFTVLSTHFHMLVRSVAGEIGNAMQRIESEYVRCFNRRNDRDGALFRGRYWSKLIENDVYLWNVVRYIDANPASGMPLIRLLMTHSTSTPPQISRPKNLRPRVQSHPKNGAIPLLNQSRLASESISNQG